ncbi:MAG: Putative binding domain, N-terminal [Bacteriophage sp.]|nr:MAG: Putative binding domain, N-terminal [Bacteriophage sp.]
MNKSFLSVSPSEGNGNAQVVINVKENMSLDVKGLRALESERVME